MLDPVTGQDQGPTITSIAITNQPFIQGMAPLAARHPSAAGVRARAALTTTVVGADGQRFEVPISQLLPMRPAPDVRASAGMLSTDVRFEHGSNRVG